MNIVYNLALPPTSRRKHVSSEKPTLPRPPRYPTQYHSVPEQAWAALVLSSPSLSQLSTPSPARNVLPVCVSVHLRGAQPSRTDAARSSTCRTRRSGTWGKQGPYTTTPTGGRCGGQRCPRRCRCSSGSRREWISQRERRRSLSWWFASRFLLVLQTPFKPGGVPKASRFLLVLEPPSGFVELSFYQWNSTGLTDTLKFVDFCITSRFLLALQPPQICRALDTLLCNLHLQPILLQFANYILCALKQHLETAQKERYLFIRVGLDVIPYC